MAQKRVIEIEAKADKALGELEAVRKELQDLNKEVVSSNKNTEDSLKGIQGAASKASKGIKAIGTTLKAAGIGLVIAAFAKFKEVLEENQKISDAFSRTFEFVSLVLNQVVNALVDTYESVTKSSERFDALGRVLSNILTLGLTPLKSAFYALKLGIQEVQYAWEKWIGGADPERLAELDAGIQATKDSLKEVVVGAKDAAVGIYNDFGEAVSEVVDITKEGVENLSKVNAKAAWEKWIGGADPERLAELDAGIQATKDSLKEVVVGAKDAAVGIYNDFGEAVSEVVDITKEGVENLSKVNAKAAWETSKTIVDLRKQAELAAAVNQGLIEKYDRQAEIQRQIRDDETKSIEERTAANEKLGEILEEQKTAMLENAQAAVRLAEFDLQKNDSLENQIKLQEAQNELAGIEAQITGFQSEQLTNKNALLRESQELTQSDVEAQNARSIAQKQANADLIDSEIGRLTIQRQLLEEEKAMEIERLTAKRDSYQKGTQAYIDANNELLDYQADADTRAAQMAKDLNQAKMDAVMTGLSGIAQLVGESSGFGKAIAVTQAIIDTYAGANKALAQGGIFGGIAAAGIIAGGLANVKNIVSTQEPAAPSFARGGTSTSTPVPAARPTPPSINVVGASGAAQLAGVVGASLDRPVKAYVVSKDVSSAQEFDRNVQGDASLG